MKPPSIEPIQFEPEFIDGLKAVFENMIVFNQLLGLRIAEIRPDSVRARIAMRPDLVGHFLHQRLHGGVISAGLAAIGARHMDDAPAKRLERFAKLGTIDLRIDYLRPAIGAHFELSAKVPRLGGRVASTRMEFAGADGTLLAAGAAAYIVS